MNVWLSISINLLRIIVLVVVLILGLTEVISIGAGMAVWAVVLLTVLAQLATGKV